MAIKVNGNALVDGVVDMTYSETYSVTCEANGFPKAETKLSSTDVSAELNAIKDAETGAIVHVTCAAGNKLNDEQVEVEVDLKPICK